MHSVCTLEGLVSLDGMRGNSHLHASGAFADHLWTSGRLFDIFFYFAKCRILATAVDGSRVVSRDTLEILNILGVPNYIFPPVQLNRTMLFVPSYAASGYDPSAGIV